MTCANTGLTSSGNQRELLTNSLGSRFQYIQTNLDALIPRSASRTCLTETSADSAAHRWQNASSILLVLRRSWEFVCESEVEDGESDVSVASSVGGPAVQVASLVWGRRKASVPRFFTRHAAQELFIERLYIVFPSFLWLNSIKHTFNCDVVASDSSNLIFLPTLGFTSPPGLRGPCQWC